MLFLSKKGLNVPIPSPIFSMEMTTLFFVKTQSNNDSLFRNLTNIKGMCQKAHCVKVILKKITFLVSILNRKEKYKHATLDI